MYSEHNVLDNRMTNWVTEYVDIYSLLIGQTPVIVVSSAISIRRVMDENPASTSGRPQFHMVGLISDPGTNMSTTSYSKPMLPRIGSN